MIPVGDAALDEHAVVAGQPADLVGRDLAATVFADPLAASTPDDDHSDTEERWVTMGRATNGTLLVISHTYREVGVNAADVRIISARRATSHERRQYESDR